MNQFMQGFLDETVKDAGLKTLGLMAAMAAAPAAGVGTHLLTRPDLAESRRAALSGSYTDLVHKQLTASFSEHPEYLARHLKGGGESLSKMKRTSQRYLTEAEQYKHPGIVPALNRIRSFFGRYRP